jgi:hypothetical protein
MAVDAVQQSLAGIQIPQAKLPLHDLGPIVTAEAMRQEPLRQSQITQNRQQEMMNQYKLDEASRQQRLQSNLDKKLPRDATTLDHDILAAYNAEIGGTPPVQVDRDGRNIYDMQAIRNLMANKRALEFEAAGGFNKLSPFSQQAMSTLAKNGYLAAAWDPKTNQVKDEAGLAAAVSGMPRVSPKDALAVQDQILKYDEIISQVGKARQLISEETVGPAAGNKLAVAKNYVVAALGGSDKKFQDQQELRRFVNQQALTAAEKMSGALSDNDIKFLMGSVIGMGDTPQAWMDFLDVYEKSAHQAKANRLAGVHFLAGSNTPMDATGNPTQQAGMRGMTGQDFAAASSAAAGVDGVDLSSYDQQPPLVPTLANSQVLRGELRTGKGNRKLLKMAGSWYEISDSQFNAIQMMKRNAFNQAAPAQPQGDLSNVTF